MQEFKTKTCLYPLLLSMLFMPFLMAGQDSDLGNWIIYFGNKKLNKGWDIHHEVQYRNYNAIGDLEQLLLRTGIGKNLSEGNNNLLLGYGYIWSENYLTGSDEKEDIHEHRIFQQFITRQTDYRVKFMHRFRIEQRWIEGDFRTRFRYFLSINIPFNNRDMEPNTWYASLYNEIFINGENDAFDRDRVYLGIGYRLNKLFRFELGYMAQLFEEGSRDQINMVTFCNF